MRALALAAFVLVLGGCDVADPQPSLVVITTARTSYRVGDTVRVTATNVSKDTLDENLCVGTDLERLDGTAWMNTGPAAGTNPCDLYVRYLFPGASDSVIFALTQPGLSTGIYRYQFNALGTSNAFGVTGPW